MDRQSQTGVAAVDDHEGRRRADEDRMRPKLGAEVSLQAPIDRPTTSLVGITEQVGENGSRRTRAGANLNDPAETAGLEVVDVPPEYCPTVVVDAQPLQWPLRLDRIHVIELPLDDLAVVYGHDLEPVVAEILTELRALE